MSNDPSSTGVEPNDTAPSEHPPLSSTSHTQPDPSGHQQPETSPLPSTELKYLIVEDNKVNRKLMEKLLERRLGLEGQFHMTTNGQEGIDAYKKNPQQCRFIFMDIAMPVKGGMEASKEIRDYEREQGLSPAVIVGMHPRMVVGRDFDTQAERFKNEFGMDEVIDKPVRTDALKSVIEKWPV